MNNFHTQQSDYNFKEMTDEQVVVIAQQEQNEFAIDYIVNKYKINEYTINVRNLLTEPYFL